MKISVTLLGNPVEVYFYGQQYTVIFISFIPMTAALAYLYVPVYFDLQLTSAYEVTNIYLRFSWNFTINFLCLVFWVEIQQTRPDHVHDLCDSTFGMQLLLDKSLHLPKKCVFCGDSILFDLKRNYIFFLEIT